MRARCRQRCVHVLVIASSTLAIAVMTLLTLPLLFASSHVARTGAILHLANDPKMQGDAYVAMLFRQGLTQQVICGSSQASWDFYPADSSRDHLIELGVPREAVSVLHLPILDCGGELVPLLIDALKAKGVKSVLLVTDPTITRYAAWRVRQRFAAEGIDASVTFAPDDRRALLDDWWRSHWKAQRMVGTVMNSTIDLLYAPCR